MLPRGRSISRTRVSLDQVIFSPPALLGRVGSLESSANLKERASSLVRESLRKVPERDGRSRHLTNALVQSQSPGQPTKTVAKAHYDGSPVVVIAFEGTGAFDARRPALMQRLGRELQASGQNTQDGRFHPERLVDEALTQERGRGAKWSGLSSGPLKTIVKDPELNSNVQWLSFPSEEAEILSDTEAYKNVSARRLISDIRRSSGGASQGINHALERVEEIAAEARKQGKSPKFVLLSHSSGGRTAVKFAEKLKRLKNPSTGENFKVETALTIDPVKEAHEAMVEAGREVINKKAEELGNSVRELMGIPQRRVYPPNVGSRLQRKTLFHSDGVNKWVNFYQRTDTLGLKLDIRFGIHGSPVHRAENIEIKNTKDDGHGAIAYHPRVLRRVAEELRRLTKQ